jgi:hypothetical protein
VASTRGTLIFISGNSSAFQTRLAFNNSCAVAMLDPTRDMCVGLHENAYIKQGSADRCRATRGSRNAVSYWLQVLQWRTAAL